MFIQSSVFDPDTMPRCINKGQSIALPSEPHKLLVVVDRAGNAPWPTGHVPRTQETFFAV